MYRNGCSTLVRTLALIFSAFSLSASSFFRVPGRLAINQETSSRRIHHEFTPPDDFPKPGFYTIRYDGAEELKVIVGLQSHGC